MTIKTATENIPQHNVLYIDEYKEDWYFLGEPEWSIYHWEFYAPVRQESPIMDRDGVVRIQPKRIVISVNKDKFQKNWHPLVETPQY